MKRIYISAAVISAFSLNACSKSSSGKSGTTTSSAVSSDVTSLKDLSLSGVLAINLPTSVVGGSTSLALTSESKSFEACKLRQEMREGLSNIAQASTMLCMLENDPSLKFGVKYNVDFSAMGGGAGAGGSGPGGSGAGAPDGSTSPPGFPGSPLRLASGMPESLQIWIDNSTEGKLTVYMCQDKKLSQMIEVTGASKGKAKGNLIMDQSLSLGELELSFSRAMTFDSGYTTEGTSVLTLKELVGTKTAQFGEEKARRLLAMSLTESGVSKVLSSFSGSMNGSTNQFSSVGVFDSSYGSVIAKGSFQPTGSEAIEFSNESYFTNKSVVVDPILYPDAFGETGSVKVAVTDLPGFLSDTFAPESFPATAWDCSGTTDLVFDMSASSGSGSGISSCTGEFKQLPEQDCMGAGFAAGAAVTIDASTLPPADKVDVAAGVSAGSRPGK